MNVCFDGAVVCQNGGTCSDTGCACLDEFSGRSCEISNGLSEISLARLKLKQAKVLSSSFFAQTVENRRHISLGYCIIILADNTLSDEDDAVTDVMEPDSVAADFRIFMDSSVGTTTSVHMYNSSKQRTGTILKINIHPLF